MDGCGDRASSSSSSFCGITWENRFVRIVEIDLLCFRCGGWLHLLLAGLLLANDPNLLVKVLSSRSSVAQSLLFILGRNQVLHWEENISYFTWWKTANICSMKHMRGAEGARGLTS